MTRTEILRCGAGVLAALALTSCARGPEPGSLSGWNVLLITIDTLRADRLGFSGYEAAETPALDGLAHEGVVFENAVASAPVTLPSHATLLTGCYPPAHGALDNAYYSLPDDVPSLATLLKAQGYETAAVVGAYVLHRQFGLAAGFDRYDDFFRQPRAGDPEPRERRAAEVSARAGEWLAARGHDRPFFLWVHLFDPHAPYDPPAPWASRFAARPYDGEIAYTDASVGALLESLSATGNADRTLVIVTADHGEALGDGGEPTHGLLLRASTLHVPLVLRARGALPAGRRVKGLVPTVDLLPTVLDLLGVETPEGVDGNSALDVIRAGRSEGQSAYSETRYPANSFGWSMLAGARTDEWAWVRGPIPELYDLAADPLETENLARTPPASAPDLDGDVERVLAGARATSTRSALSAEQVEALRSLGYAYSAEAPDASGADPKERLSVLNRYNDVRRVFLAGHYDEAVAELEDLRLLDPGNHEVRVLLGQALVKSGRVDEGLGEFRLLLDAGRVRGRTGTIFAEVLGEAGREKEAETLLRMLGRSEPEDVGHAFQLAQLLLRQGRWVEARAACERALRLAPEAVHVLANLALSLSLGKDADPARALEMVDRAMELSPDDDRPLLVKATVLANAGRAEDAQTLLRELAARPELQGITRKDVAAVMRRLRERP